MKRGARHKPWNHAWPPTWYLANNRWRISSWNFTVTIFFVIFYLILQIVLCHRDFHRKIPCQIACMFRIFLYYFRFDSRLHKIQLYCRFFGNFCISVLFHFMVRLISFLLSLNLHNIVSIKYVPYLVSICFASNIYVSKSSYFSISSHFCM